MQEELRRCNYLGDVESIYRLARIMSTDSITSVSAVSNRCMIEQGLDVKPRLCMLFFKEIGMIDIHDDQVTLLHPGEIATDGDFDTFVKKTTELALNHLLDNGYLNCDAISFDEDKARCIVRKSAFPLSVAAIRNFLIDAKMLADYSNSEYILSEAYESFFEETVKTRKAAMSLDDLKKRQEKQAEQGRTAEEYVVRFERERLSQHPEIEKIKQISDFDVAAGYDIISYNDVHSKVIDRFIEVKSYYGTPHFFWSANEYKQSILKGSLYYLYLVDMEKIGDPSYVPIIISNPSDVVMTKDDWIVETASYEITHVQG